jgi:PAS domain S-box-containing protein
MGRERFVEVTAAPILNAAGEVTHIIEACRDITGRMRAEEALAQDRNLLRALIDNLPDCIYVKDAQHRFMAANLATASLMGVAASNDLLGKSDSDFYPPEAVIQYRADEEELLCSGQPLVNKEEPHLDAKGNLRTVLTTKVPLRDGAGKIVGLVGISRDITDRKRAEEALHDINRRLATTLESITDAFFSVDRNWTVTSVNAAAEKIWRKSRDEVLGRNLWELFPEAVSTRFHEEYQRALRENVTVHLEEYYAPLALWAEVHAYPSEVGLAFYFRDITQRKRAEEDLRKARDLLEIRVRERTAELVATNEELRHAKDDAEAASRAKSAFLANMSHELRTPMNAVIGMTELVLGSQLSGRQREFLTAVKDSGEALLSMIDNILDFSQIEAGKLVLAKQTFDLQESLGDLMNSFTAPARQKGLKLACFVHPDVPRMLTGDYDRLRQVVVNLVRNAIEFTERGEVLLEVARESLAGQDLVLQFTVSDTGIGVSEDMQSTIFKVFEQADSSLSRRHGGTGLGLAIASRLVGLMQGRIWVESEVGRGSRFHFTIRVDPAKPGTVEV